MISSIQPIFVGLYIGLFAGQCEHTINSFVQLRTKVMVVKVMREHASEHLFQRE